MNHIISICSPICMCLCFMCYTSSTYACVAEFGPGLTVGGSPVTPVRFGWPGVPPMAGLNGHPV